MHSNTLPPNNFDIIPANSPVLHIANSTNSKGVHAGLGFSGELAKLSLQGFLSWKYIFEFILSLNRWYQTLTFQTCEHTTYHKSPPCDATSSLVEMEGSSCSSEVFYHNNKFVILPLKNIDCRVLTTTIQWRLAQGALQGGEAGRGWVVE